MRKSRAPAGAAIFRFVVGTSALLVPGGAVYGEIRAFSGQVQAVARGIAQAPQDSFSKDEDAYERTVEPPVIDATAELATTDIDGNPLAAGRSIVILGDPRVSAMENPGEFALECGTFSNDPRIAYRLDGSATEHRDVRFTLAEVIGGGGAAPRQVASRVFISGALVLWATQAGGSLLDAEAEFAIEVHDSRQTQAPVLQIRRRFTGDASGRVTAADAISLGIRGRDLQTSILDLPALRASQAPEAAALVEQADRLGIDTFVVVLIGPQSVEYAYDLTPGITFGLEARFSLAVQSAPSGTGVAGVMGRPFAGLADLFEQSRTDGDGKLLERSINKLIEEGTGPADSPDDPGTVRPAFMCGALGAEFLLVFGWLMLGGSRRHRCKRSAA